MRIMEIRELAVPLNGQISNSVVNFAEHDVSLVAVISDVVKSGHPVIGYAFNSIGRFAQGGILRDRIIPRILSADSDKISDGLQFDCAAIYQHAVRNEKPGGHGDRASAIGALELAFWDLNAKLRDEPAYATIARHFGRQYSDKVNVYAAGGYYSNKGNAGLYDELREYINQGFDAFKIKIGGATLQQDMERIDVALQVCGNGARLAVDANGRFDFDTAMDYARHLEPMKLRWYEEIGDPLDFRLNANIAERYSGAIATGENLFSVQDVKNLLEFGGMRPSIDIFQMDAGLSYGLGHFAQIIELMESYGFNRGSSFPHGGHLINLHIAAGLNLGGCEAYPNVFQPFGGYSPQCTIADGYIRPADHPGFGLEAKPEIQAVLREIST